MLTQVEHWQVEMTGDWERVTNDGPQFWHRFRCGTLRVEVPGSLNTLHTEHVQVSHRDRGDDDRIEPGTNLTMGDNGSVGSDGWVRDDHSNIECWRLSHVRNTNGRRGIVHIQRPNGEPRRIEVWSNAGANNVLRLTVRQPQPQPQPVEPEPTRMEAATDMVLDLRPHTPTIWSPTSRINRYWQTFHDANAVRVHVRRRTNDRIGDLVHVSASEGDALMVSVNGTVHGPHEGWHLHPTFSRALMDYWVCGEQGANSGRASVEIEWTSPERHHISSIRVWGIRSADPLWLDAPQPNITQPDPELERILDEERFRLTSPQAPPSSSTRRRSN